MKKRIIIIIAVLLSVFSMKAQFSGSGSGTQEDPYRIFTAAQLNQVRNFTHSQVYFSLEADIDLESWIEDNNPEQGWMPIDEFCGTFVGNNHTISNLMINRPSRDNVGLFGLVYTPSIRELKIANAKILGGNNTGILIGRSDYFSNKIGQIVDVYISDSDAKGSENVGAVIGLSYMSALSIRSCNCYDVCISASDSGAAGGIVGRCTTMDRYDHGSHYFEMNNNIFSGQVTGCYSGGILGATQAPEPIFSINNRPYYHNYANVAISGKYVGGIIGYCFYEDRWNYGLDGVEECYATGVVLPYKDGTSYASGIVGCYNAAYSTLYNLVIHCYSNFTYLSGNIVSGITKEKDGTQIEEKGVTGSVAAHKCLDARDATYRIGSAITENNLAYNKTNLLCGFGEIARPEDSAENGTNTGMSTLMLEDTYKGLGWNFDLAWKIAEGQSLPYFNMQTAPVFFDSELKKGDTHLEGTCLEDGTLTVTVGPRVYTTATSGGKWAIDIEPLESGEYVCIYVTAPEREMSTAIWARVELPGKGTEAEPFEICDAYDLAAIRTSGHYKLLNDINLDSYIESTGWKPLFANSAALTCMLDGNGHRISGFSYNVDTDNVDSDSPTGIFSRTNPEGYIRNLTVEVADKGIFNNSATTYAGVVCGENNGSISECAVIGGTLNTNCTSGVIAGSNSGTIENCYTTCDIKTPLGSNEAYSGGISGVNKGSIQRCYASGSISGSRVGGVCGFLSGTSAGLKSCVALNKEIDGYTYALRVLGGLDGGTSFPENNYALKNMQVISAGSNKDVYDDPMEGTSISNDQSMAKTTYTDLGWDFDNVWTINEGEGYPYFVRDYVRVQSISLDKTSLNAEVGNSVTIAAEILPGNASDKRINWKSSDTSVAEVSSEGVVTVISDGTCVITAESVASPEIYAQCTVFGYSSIDVIHSTEESNFNVYNSQGILIREKCRQDEINNLPRGLYIIGNKKVYVR